MSKALIITSRKFTAGGIKLQNQMDEFTPPVIKPVYADVPGSFMGEKEVVGFENAEWKATFKGVNADIILGALVPGALAVILVSESGRQGTSTYTTERVMTGHVAYDTGAGKMKEARTLTLTGQISKYVFTENGKPIDAIDIANGKYIIGGHVYA